MDTLDMLRDILIAYDGTLFIVSHDRDFMDRVVTKTLAFEGDGKVEGIVGGYSDYMAFKRAQEAEEKEEKSAPAKTKTAPKTETVKPAKTENTKLSFKLQHELEQLPKTIEALEREINALSDSMADPSLYMSNPGEFDRVSKRLPRAQKELETAEARWIELEEMQSMS